VPPAGLEPGISEETGELLDNKSIAGLWWVSKAGIGDLDRRLFDCLAEQPKEMNAEVPRHSLFTATFRHRRGANGPLATADWTSRG